MVASSLSVYFCKYTGAVDYAAAGVKSTATLTPADGLQRNYGGFLQGD